MAFASEVSLGLRLPPSAILNRSRFFRNGGSHVLILKPPTSGCVLGIRCAPITGSFVPLGRLVLLHSNQPFPARNKASFMVKPTSSMNVKPIVQLAVAIVAAACLTYLVASQRNEKAATQLRAKHAAELSDAVSQKNALLKQIEAAQLERDQYKTAAAEVHKLRGEISQLRKENESLQKTAAAALQKAESAESNSANSALTSGAIPESFADHTTLGQFAAGLRAKASKGQLSPEELQWLQQIKPELEKLESQPRDFAAFQAAMIQEVTGVTDPQKAEQIRNTVQHVYEAANQRGLDLQSRPAEEDAAWIEQRHQLDRRGTGAVQKLLTEEERAAFDRSFLGIMGVDLGTGVDKSLYPRDFNTEKRISR